MLLLDIAEQFPGKVAIIPFSHSREARIGADAAAAALSKLFEGNGDDEGLGPDVVLPFDPTREWPKLFKDAEKFHRMRVTGMDWFDLQQLINTP